MCWFGGGSEPLPGASADCAEKELCWVSGADCAGTAPRRPLRGAAMSGDGTILCTMRRRRWRLRAVVAAAAAAKAADVLVGRWRQRTARRWRLGVRSEAQRWAAI